MAVHVASRSRLLSWYSCKKRVKCIGTVLTTVYWHADRMLQCLMGGMAPCCVVGTIWLGGLPTTVPGATWIEMTKMQAPQKKGGKQFKARSGQEWTVQVSEVHAVSKETLLLFPPWLSAFSFFSKARQEICRDNLVLVQGSKAKTDSRQKRTKGCKKSPEKIKEKTTTSNPRRGT